MIKKAGDIEVIVFHENDAVFELGQCRNLHDLLDQTLPPLVGGMGLTRKNKLHRPFRVIDDFRQLVEVTEKQSRPLIGRKTASEPDGEGLGIQQLVGGANVSRAGSVSEPLVTDVRPGELQKL